MWDMIVKWWKAVWGGWMGVLVVGVVLSSAACGDEFKGSPTGPSSFKTQADVQKVEPQQSTVVIFDVMLIGL